MRKSTCLFMTLLLASGLSRAAPPGGPLKTFVGNIGDSMCGSKHTMPGKSAKECTLECIKEGSKYILVGSKGKIYQLSDQKKLEPSAGAKVKVTGTLTGDTITVASITAAR